MKYLISIIFVLLNMNIYSQTNCNNNKFYLECHQNSRIHPIHCSDVGNITLSNCVCGAAGFKRYLTGREHDTDIDYGACENLIKIPEKDGIGFFPLTSTGGTSGGGSTPTSSTTLTSSTSSSGGSDGGNSESCIKETCGYTLHCGNFIAQCNDNSEIKGITPGEGAAACSCHNGLLRYLKDSETEGPKTGQNTLYDHWYLCKDGKTFELNNTESIAHFPNSCDGHQGISAYKIFDKNENILESWPSDSTKATMNPNSGGSSGG